MMPLDSSLVNILDNHFPLQQSIVRCANVSSISGTTMVRERSLLGQSFCQNTHHFPVSAKCAAAVRSGVGVSTLPSSSSRPASAKKSSFHLPSVTWEVVQDYKDKIIAREEVTDFLKAEGINTDQFELGELPSSIDIVKERLEFLFSLGLEKQHINEYPIVVCSSVRKNLVPVIDYLGKLGFTSKTLRFLVRKYPMVLHASVVVDLQPVIGYLEGLGIERKDIAKVLLKYPDVLGLRLEGTISTSVAYLASIGLGTREIGTMLTQYPQILGMRVGSKIKPKVDYFNTLGLPKGAAAKIFAKHPNLLGLELDDEIRPAIAALISAGISEQALPAIIAGFPNILAIISLEEKLARKHVWLTKHLCIEPEDVAMIVEKYPQIIVIDEGLAIERVNFLRDSGDLEEHDIRKMVTSYPQIMALSIENALCPALNFFMNEMKRPLQELVDFPAYFTYNLEDRIRPRYEQIRQKGIDCSLQWFLNCSDSNFQEKIGMDFIKDLVAETKHSSYQMGGSLDKEHSCRTVDENESYSQRSRSVLLENQTK